MIIVAEGINVGVPGTEGTGVGKEELGTVEGVPGERVVETGKTDAVDELGTVEEVTVVWVVETGKTDIAGIGLLTVAVDTVEIVALLVVGAENGGDSLRIGAKVVAAEVKWFVVVEVAVEGGTMELGGVDNGGVTFFVVMVVVVCRTILSGIVFLSFPLALGGKIIETDGVIRVSVFCSAIVLSDEDGVTTVERGIARGVTDCSVRLAEDFDVSPCGCAVLVESEVLLLLAIEADFVEELLVATDFAFGAVATFGVSAEIIVGGFGNLGVAIVLGVAFGVVLFLGARFVCPIFGVSKALTAEAPFVSTLPLVTAVVEVAVLGVDVEEEVIVVEDGIVR